MFAIDIDDARRCWFNDVMLKPSAVYVKVHY